MGLNTAMIVRNDFLHEIRKDQQFGEKVWTAIAHNGDERRMPYLGQSFSILPSSHADCMQVVAIGGNCIRRLGHGGAYSASDEEVLRTLARSMGYDLKRRSRP